MIGIPPRGHRSLVEASAAAGKHILIEKPVFARFDELVALWPALTAHRATVMVAENVHYRALHLRTKALLADAGLGRPLVLDLVRLGRVGGRRAGAPTPRRCRSARSTKGACMDTRLLDLAAVFDGGRADNVVDVYAVGPPAPVTTTPGEDTTMVVARPLGPRVAPAAYLGGALALSPFDASKLLAEHGALYFDARGVFGRLYTRRAAQVALALPARRRRLRRHVA